MAPWKRILKTGQDIEELRWTLALDALIALAWLFGAPGRSTGHAYDAVRQIAGPLPGYSLRWFGALMAVLVVGVELAARAHKPVLTAVAMQLLSAYWAWWCAMFVYGISHNGGFVLAILAFGLTRRHYKLRAAVNDA